MDNSDVNILAATGEISGYGAQGKTEFVLEYRTDGAVAVAPILNFTVSNIAAETATFLSDPPVEVDFTFDAFANGGGDRYSASATARATYNNAEIVNQNNMSGTANQYECTFGLCFRAAYIFDDISDAILVGVLNPGNIATIVVEMTAELTFNGLEQGAYARIRDSNGSGLTYWTTFADVPTGRAPAPATWLQMLAGIFAILRRFARSQSS